jgi:hypothetical protein
MSVRGVSLAVALFSAAVALSACHDGTGKRTETTQVRITGTPKAGYVAPARHEAAKPAPAASGSGSPDETGVAPQPTSH